MAQIIKHRRGSIDSVKGTTTRNGEILVASGSISDLSGPFVFIGSPVSSDEGVQGAFKPTSKIYQGTAAPTIAVGSYGSILDGTPFYASGNQSLYTLNSDAVGNQRLDLTGNMEGNSISNVTITSLTGSNANLTNVTGGTVTVTGNQTIDGSLRVTGTTGLGDTLDVTNTATVGKLISLGEITGSNLRLSGNADIAGNINLGGNITVGDATTDFVTFGADISSSIIPDVNNAFDLGSTTQAWRDLHVSGTAYVENLEAATINLDSITVINNLTVSGSTDLFGDVVIGDSDTDILQVVSGDIEFLNIPAEETTKFIGLNDQNKLVQDEIDSRVLGNTLVDNNGTPLVANRISFASDGDSLQDDAQLTYNKTTNVLTVDSSTVGTNVSAGGTLTVGTTTQLKGAVGINSSLDVTGSVNLKDTVNIVGNLGVTGNTTTTGTVTVNNTLNVTGLTTLEGNTDIEGNLTVTGSTNLQGNLYVSGNLEILGSATSVVIQSQTLEIDDNIIRLNAYSPFERYAGFEVIDSGSTGVSASLVWDSQEDYWMFVSASGESSKLIGTTAGTYGSEISLTTNLVPKSTGDNNIGDSKIGDNGTTLTYNTNKFTVASADGATLIAGNVTLSSAGGLDAGSNSSIITFKNSSNVLGYVSATETTDVLDGILGYKSSDGSLAFSTVIDGGTY
jgi:cytoskeletal protein CcmA (bactofilin family)